MNKLEKLKEIHAQINKIISKIETRMFIENISDIKEKIIQEEKPKAITETNQQV
jgi:hypothetical protein